MSFFTQQTKVVDLGEGNTVTVRKLTFGERQNITSACSDADARTQEFKIDFAKLRIERAKIAISSWEGPGFEGRNVSPENIAALPTDIADIILEAIDELNDEVSAEEGNE